MSDYHLPVLLKESVDGLEIKPDGVYVDVTFGGGGHSREVLKQLMNGRLFAFDQDKEATKNLPEDDSITFIHSNYRFLKQFLRYYKVAEIDGLIADLGVSSHHFDSEERGFSFRFNSKLDMRMNTSSGLTAGNVINDFEEDALANIFFYYGEIRNARLLAKRIVDARNSNQIKTTEDFKKIVIACTPAKHQVKYLSQAFQAVRIEVNNELKALKELLVQSTEMLKSGGRISVITYHSLEDRLVKNYFKSGNFEGEAEKDFYGNISSPFKLVNKKVIIADNEELNINSRARSAKLRIAEKK